MGATVTSHASKKTAYKVRYTLTTLSMIRGQSGIAALPQFSIPAEALNDVIFLQLTEPELQRDLPLPAPRHVPAAKMRKPHQPHIGGSGRGRRDAVHGQIGLAFRASVTARYCQLGELDRHRYEHHADGVPRPTGKRRFGGARKANPICD